MPVLSSIFFVAALAFAMTIGPQTRPWTWGPALLCLGLALACGLRCRLQKDIRLPGPLLLTLACVTAAWFATRAILSPVAEFSRADLLLLAAVTGAFCWIRTIDGHVKAQGIFDWGVATLLASNLVVMCIQWKDPSFIPLFHSKPAENMLTGFFNHYIETCNFLVAVSLWTAGAALWGPHRTLTKSLFLMLAMAGLAGVVFSSGRGGVAGGAVGSAAFFVLMFIQAQKRKAKWFGPAVIAVPILAAGAAVYLFFGWQSAQEIRGTEKQQAADISRMFDNNTRLFAIKIALECIGQHPLAGGGARSFSWESYQFNDPVEYGDMTTCKLEFVHNEFLQSAADYGLAGALLVLLFLIACGLNCFVRSILQRPAKSPDPGDALRLGGFAALAGMTTQACFAFSFHLIPGALLLGASLGMIAFREKSSDDRPPVLAMRLLLAAPAAAAMALLLWFGVIGSIATRILWKSEYSKYRHLHAASRIDNLATARAWWPDSSLCEQQGIVILEQDEAGQSEQPNASEQAIDAFLAGTRLNPYEPVFAIYLGNTYSLQNNDPQAELWLEKAILLQGKQEPAFRSHYSLANHYLLRGQREFLPDNPGQALATMEKAAAQIEIAIRKMHWADDELLQFRLLVHESLGRVREANHDLTGALESYQFAASMPTGQRAHYLTAGVLGKMAKEAWHQRNPEQALSLFMQARLKVEESSSLLPAGISPENRLEFIAQLNHSIAFLKAAKVDPK